MSQLYRVFNTSEVQLLRMLYKAFPESTDLHDELIRQVNLIKGDIKTDKIFKEFENDLSVKVGDDKTTVEDLLFKSDPLCIPKIGFLRRSNVEKLYPRFHKESGEDVKFWESLQSLCKYRGMLGACGSHIGDMENMAMSFIEENPDLKPHEYHQRVFQQMLSGDGTISKQLIDTFKKPGAIQGILKNFGNIIRTPGQDPVDLSAIAKLAESEDLENLDEQFEEMKQEMKSSGINPFEAMSNGFSTQDEDGKPTLPKELQNVNISDMMSKLVGKLGDANLTGDIKNDAQLTQEIFNNMLNSSVEKQDVTSLEEEV